MLHVTLFCLLWQTFCIWCSATWLSTTNHTWPHCLASFLERSFNYITASFCRNAEVPCENVSLIWLSTIYRLPQMLDTMTCPTQVTQHDVTEERHHTPLPSPQPPATTAADARRASKYTKKKCIYFFCGLHALQRCRSFLCSHTPTPPHSTHLLLCLPCAQCAELGFRQHSLHQLLWIRWTQRLPPPLLQDLQTVRRILCL
jgi:hypothetical protein